MKKLTSLLPLLFLLTTMSAQPTAGSEPTPREDMVSTLKLSEPLKARGTLGGITVDALGFIYVANFAEAVWRISPDGEVKLISDGLYGSSGNTIDVHGNLWQGNFNGNSITKISRFGEIKNYTDPMFNGPVGMVFDEDKNLYICNCNDNKILKMDSQKSVSVFSSSELLSCPNGITKDADGNLYVVNFNNDHVLKLTGDGQASIFSTIGNAQGNAHVAYAKGHLYVSKIRSNNIYKIDPEGNGTVLAGVFAGGHEDGPVSSATFFHPNGIAAGPLGKTIYLNEVVGEWRLGAKTEIAVRKIDLISIGVVLKESFDGGGIEALETAYHTYKNDPARKFEDTSGETASFGWGLMSSGKFQEALRVFQLLNESYPERWRTHYNLGEVYKIFGQKEQAIEYYQKALELSPGNTVITGKLDDLKG